MEYEPHIIITLSEARQFLKDFNNIKKPTKGIDFIREINDFVEKHEGV